MSKLVFLSDLKNIDCIKEGLVCGLEIHQQLNVGKLFCSCPCDIVPNESLTKNVERKLRFSAGESGAIDAAALHEFKHGKLQHYKYNNEIACLVDLDEEPPHPPRKEAVETALKVGTLLNLEFFSELQFMRKLIVDGSIVSGFQRTAMIGFAGYLKTSFGEVSIDAVNIEEDSCRNIERNDTHNIFSLDRQGIPLIEITTGPHIKHPQEAYELALQLGNILRSFKEVRRGIGTIRQDLNVSIPNGARIEIKGSQNLELIPSVIEAEVKRQLIHLSLIEELRERGVTKEKLDQLQIVDVSKVFSNCKSAVINSGLENNGVVLGVKLESYKGILGHDMQEDFRFASEIAKRIKRRFPKIKGLLHSDELPKFDITQEEVEEVCTLLECRENDGYLLICQGEQLAQNALEYAIEIVQEISFEVPSEVRQVDPKGTQTQFLRPMPGSARMYPETDVPNIKLENDYLKELKEDLPELYDVKMKRLQDEYNLDSSKLEELFKDYNENEVKEMLKISAKNASQLYSILYELPKDIKKRDNIEIIDLNYSLLLDILSLIKQDSLSQQSIRDIFVSLYKDKLNEVEKLKEYLDENGVLGEAVDENEIEEKIKTIISENEGAPFGALMGLAMKEFQGKVDGKLISSILKKLL